MRVFPWRSPKETDRHWICFFYFVKWLLIIYEWRLQIFPEIRRERRYCWLCLPQCASPSGSRTKISIDVCHMRVQVTAGNFLKKIGLNKELGEDRTTYKSPIYVLLSLLPPSFVFSTSSDPLVHLDVVGLWRCLFFVAAAGTRGATKGCARRHQSN